MDDKMYLKERTNILGTVDAYDLESMDETTIKKYFDLMKVYCDERSTVSVDDIVEAKWPAGVYYKITKKSYCIGLSGATCPMHKHPEGLPACTYSGYHCDETGVVVGCDSSAEVDPISDPVADVGLWRQFKKYDTYAVIPSYVARVIRAN